MHPCRRRRRYRRTCSRFWRSSAKQWVARLYRKTAPSRKQNRNRSFGKGDWKAFFRLIPYIRLPWVLIAIAFVVDLTYSDVLTRVPVSTSALFAGEFTGSALFEAIVYNALNYGLMFASLILSSVVSAIAVRRAQENLWGRMLRLDMAY